jgi:hypothetical protein
MPTKMISNYAKKSKKPRKEVERLWRKAKRIAAKSGHEEDYGYINGILKKMLSLSEDEIRMHELAGVL